MPWNCSQFPVAKCQPSPAPKRTSQPNARLQSTPRKRRTPKLTSKPSIPPQSAPLSPISHPPAHLQVRHLTPRARLSNMPDPKEHFQAERPLENRGLRCLSHPPFLAQKSGLCGLASLLSGLGFGPRIAIEEPRRANQTALEARESAPRSQTPKSITKPSDTRQSAPRSQTPNLSPNARPQSACLRGGWKLHITFSADPHHKEG